jgi:hypothetical protein
VLNGLSYVRLTNFMKPLDLVFGCRISSGAGLVFECGVWHQLDSALRDLVFFLAGTPTAGCVGSHACQESKGQDFVWTLKF